MLALTLRKRIVCYAQGVGPISGRLSMLLTRLLVGRLPLIMVRDAASADRLAWLGIDSDQVHVVADPSFCLSPAECIEVDATLKRLGITRPFAVIAVRRWGHYRGGWLPVRLSRRSLPADRHRQFDAFCSSIAAASDHLANELGLQVVFLPMCPSGDQDDDLVAQAVRRQMVCGNQALVLDEVLPPAVLKGVLGRSELVLAMRTHAGMLAAALGTPVASISYQGKGEAFMAEIGLEDYALAVEDLTSENVVELVERTWYERASISEKLTRQSPRLRARAMEATQLALREATSRRSDPRLGSAYRAIVAPKMGLTLKGRVLEVGAADGRLLHALGTSGVGLDIAPEPLSNTQTAFVRGDGTSMPFVSEPFDTVVAFDVLEHVAADHALVRELMRVVKPGGTLWISVPSRDTAIFPPWLTGWAHQQWGHVRPGYSREQIKVLFCGHGALTIMPWNEPAYRSLYLPLKTLSLVWPSAALGLLLVVAWLDEKLKRGDEGHFFVRVQMTPRECVAKEQLAGMRSAR